MRKYYGFVLSIFLCFVSTWATAQTGLNVSPTSLPPFSTVVGTPSAAASLEIRGFGLSSNVTVVAPAGYEVTVGANAPYAATQVLVPQPNGVLNLTWIQVRLSGATLGTFNGHLNISSPNAMTVQVPLDGLVALTFNPPATLTSISPSTIRPGTTLVNFYGRNFVQGATVSIYPGPIGGIGPTTFVSDTHLTAQVTAVGVGSAVSTYCGTANPGPGGGGTTPPGTVMLTVVPGPPIVTGYSPTYGRPGTLVTVQGSNFISGVGHDVFFNGVPTTLVTSPSNNALTVRVPAGATTGPITVTNVGGSATGPTNFIVPPAFFEDFETGTKTSYAPASVPLFTCGWTLAEALLGTTPGADKFNGTKSARLRGGGFLEMDVDKPNGAGVVTVSAATYATETGVSFVPEISTDGGVTYTSLLGTSAPPTLTGTLTQYSFTANRTGNVRLRFSSTNTAAATNPRINLDDVGITNFTVTSAATRPGVPTVHVYPNPAHHYLRVDTERSGPVRVALFDLTGRMILASRELPANQQLDLPASLPTGNYVLRIEHQGTQLMKRVQKQ